MLLHRIVAGGLMASLLLVGNTDVAQAGKRSAGKRSGGGGSGSGGGGGSRSKGSGFGISLGGGGGGGGGFGIRLNTPKGPPLLGGGVMQHNHPSHNHPSHNHPSNGNPSNNGKNVKSLAPNQAGNNAPKVSGNAIGFRNFNGGGQGFGGGTVRSGGSLPGFGGSDFGQPSFAATTSNSNVPSSPPSFVNVPQFSRQPISIQLQKNSVMPVNYLLNRFEFTMNPGQIQSVVEDREWIVRFDRGRGFGTAEYTLGPGNYQFVREEATGWQLYEVPDGQASANSPPPPPKFSADALLGQ